MAKYIDADDVDKIIRKKIEKTKSFAEHDALIDVKFEIEELPAADVEPVRHGKWIKTDADFHDMPMEEFKCSVCGKETCNLTDTTIPLPKFCDECGSKMDGGSE